MGLEHVTIIINNRGVSDSFMLEAVINCFSYVWWVVYGVPFNSAAVAAAVFILYFSLQELFTDITTNLKEAFFELQTIYKWNIFLKYISRSSENCKMLVNQMIFLCIKFKLC